MGPEQGFQSAISALAGARGLEPRTFGFGDRCSTNWAIPLYKNICTRSPDSPSETIPHPTHTLGPL